jgi:hypothetical protein
MPGRLNADVALLLQASIGPCWSLAAQTLLQCRAQIARLAFDVGLMEIPTRCCWPSCEQFRKNGTSLLQEISLRLEMQRASHPRHRLCYLAHFWNWQTEAGKPSISAHAACWSRHHGTAPNAASGPSAALPRISAQRAETSPWLGSLEPDQVQ